MIRAAALAALGFGLISNSYAANSQSFAGSSLAGVRFDAASTHDDRDPLIKYSGTWGQSTASNRLNGTQSYSNQAANSVAFTFSGTQISYVYARQANMGMAQIKIDDTVVDQIDEYSPMPLGFQAATYSGLSDSSHSIVVTVLDSANPQSTGKYIVVDGFLVGGASASAKVHDDADAAVSYAGAWVRSKSSARYNATQAISNTPRDSASFTFVGTQISLIYGREADFGVAQVSIDGQVVDQLDQYSAVPLGWQVATYANLTAGTHTVQVTVSGAANAQATNRYVLIDGFIGVTPDEAQSANSATGQDSGSAPNGSDSQIVTYGEAISQLQQQVASLSTSNTSAASSITALQNSITALSSQMTQVLQTVARIPAAANQNSADAEVPTGTKDGVNLTFQLANTPSPSTSLKVFKNGLLLQRDTDYTVAGTTISFKTATTPTSIDTLMVFYRW